ncbi:DUF2442 domain-containing protein [Deferrisoma sp.]
MTHGIYKVTELVVEGPYTLRLRFDDGAEVTIDFRPVLEGEVYGELKDPEVFRQVRIDPEAHTLVWPNGADFDPETLRNWDTYLPALAERARRWASRAA